MAGAVPRAWRTVLVMGGLVLVVVSGVAALSRLVVGDGGGTAHTGSRRATPKTVATTRSPTTTTRRAVPYRVQRGDTLTAIARRFGVSVTAIVNKNGITDPGRLAEGQTLLIPPPAPLALDLTPVRVTGPASVTMRLTGAKPSETITFVITSPSGPFRGPPHPVSEEGEVSATYRVGPDDPAGVYTVDATGSQGTTVQATFRVDRASG